MSALKLDGEASARERAGWLPRELLAGSLEPITRGTQNGLP